MDTFDIQRQAFKASVQTHWDSAARGWDAHSQEIRAWLRGPTDAMIAMAGVASGTRVLDVAAGAGDQTLDIAERVGPSGAVLAVDLSPAIVALAQERARRAGFQHVQCRVADGEDLGVEAASFDAAVCRLGLMLFPDPLRGLREMHRALRPGGRVCTVVFSTPARNPCIRLLMATALRHAGLPAPDPHAPGSLFSLSAPGRVDTLFRDAGFDDVATTAMDAVFRMPSVDDYLAFVRSSASPILQILSGLEPAKAQAAWEDIRAQLHAFDTTVGWEGPNELLITAGRRP
ncbi:class I SAM-dependent methyltransferase [Piscinibacter gummiphilus]|uniref:Ubiquinone biosynthesis protein UbiE n=1 Tax=Piscinibacter gummiphilus TaxID=946333 RepID=A0A1W6L7P0_9BURK|nr:class I SAM-dependent methyltransferase [Piscinibacter gummiphilus]ARN20190.1 ubiquinone biosynthesis protein UbiE [Piscinibacter gummiphilus]ATU64859.1 ubiquinone biosynthesis protein UbiE [Piscinibacter gummiphilus]GLS96519.1 methyltransferase [Piscinibacter gummiphilus]